MGWTKALDTRLRSLWYDPTLTSEAIADMMGFSRVTIWKRAKLIGLPPKERHAVETHADKFERLIDIVADFDAPLENAADAVQLPREKALALWKRLCRQGGRQYA
jgi:hypothetical protein